MIAKFLRAAAFCAAPLMAQAQQSDIELLVEAAEREVASLSDQVYAIQREMDAWKASIVKSEQTVGTSDDVQRSLQQMRDAINNHPYLNALETDCTAGALNCEPQSTVSEPAQEFLDCSTLNWTADSSGRIFLKGYVKSAEDVAFLKVKYGEGSVLGVEERPWPVCGALDALTLPMTSEQKPTVRMFAARETLNFNDSLAFEVTTPPFPAFIYIAYLQADGSVVNLTPRRGVFRKQHAPNSRLIFGDGRDGRQTYTASAPAGAEVILAIAARSPIEELESLETGADGQYRKSNGANNLIDQDSYITLLKRSLSEFDSLPEQRRGPREASAEIIHLTIMP